MTSTKKIDRLFIAAWALVAVYSIVIVAVHPLSGSPVCMEGTPE